MSRKYLTPKEAAEYIGLTEAALQKWRTNGVGIPYAKLGDGHSARIIYEVAELDEYVRARKIKTIRSY